MFSAFGDMSIKETASLFFFIDVLHIWQQNTSSCNCHVFDIKIFMLSCGIIVNTGLKILHKGNLCKTNVDFKSLIIPFTGFHNKVNNLSGLVCFL